jgi:hypothetical protein
MAAPPPPGGVLRGRLGNPSVHGGDRGIFEPPDRAFRKGRREGAGRVTAQDQFLPQLGHRPRPRGAPPEVSVVLDPADFQASQRNVDVVGGTVVDDKDLRWANRLSEQALDGLPQRRGVVEGGHVGAN